jgi:hypothetical protein
MLRLSLCGILLGKSWLWIVPNKLSRSLYFLCVKWSLLSRTVNLGMGLCLSWYRFLGSLGSLRTIELNLWLRYLGLWLTLGYFWQNVIFSAGLASVEQGWCVYVAKFPSDVWTLLFGLVVCMFCLLYVCFARWCMFCIVSVCNRTHNSRFYSLYILRIKLGIVSVM